MMHRKAILGWTIVCLLALPALAAEGRIPIFQPTVLAGPGIDGKYIVTRNIAAPLGSGPVIRVIGSGTDEVDINLNGFTLTGDPGGGFNVIAVTGVRTIRIHDGSIRPGPGASDGVNVSASDRAIVEGLRIDGGSTGISLIEVSNYTIRDNVVVNAGVGVQASGAGVIHTGLVGGNQVKNAGLFGIVVEDGHSSAIVRDNRVDGATDAGIRVAFGNTCLVAENTVEAAGIGILLEQVKGCKVINNVASYNNGNGIAGFLTESSLFLDNVATGNQGTGIFTDGGRNKFEKNQASENGCFGIWLAGRENTFGRNQARGNTGASAVCPGPAVACTVFPVEICPAPWGGGSFPPDLCVSGLLNTSYCDNLMPGPPPS